MPWTLCVTYRDICSIQWTSSSLRLLIFNFLLIQFMQVDHRYTIVGGFINGIVCLICRPRKDQRILYNGHRKVHTIKFQSAVAPNGLIANLYGLWQSFAWWFRLISRSSAVFSWAEQQHSLFVWQSDVPSRKTTYGHFSRCSKNTSSKSLEQSHESIKCIGRMDFWRNSRLPQIPGLQRGIKTPTKHHWKNVYSLCINAEC